VLKLRRRLEFLDMGAVLYCTILYCTVPGVCGHGVRLPGLQSTGLRPPGFGREVSVLQREETG